jgi:hypothetical protein
MRVCIAAAGPGAETVVSNLAAFINGNPVKIVNN